MNEWLVCTRARYERKKGTVVPHHVALAVVDWGLGRAHVVAVPRASASQTRAVRWVIAMIAAGVAASGRARGGNGCARTVSGPWRSRRGQSTA